MRLSAAEIAALAEARDGAPHDRLGLHPAGSGCVVRALLRDAAACAAVDRATGAVHPMARVHPCGLFEVALPAVAPFAHRLRVTDGAGKVSEVEDPYRFLPTLGDQDLHFLAQGDDHRIHEKLGGNPRVVDGVRGVAFAVWAPHARRVSVVGDLNGWDGRYHPMRLLGASGIWELFVPGLGPGARYKYEIVGPASPTPFLKTDPCAVGRDTNGLPAGTFPSSVIRITLPSGLSSRCARSRKSNPSPVVSRMVRSGSSTIRPPKCTGPRFSGVAV